MGGRDWPAYDLGQFGPLESRCLNTVPAIAIFLGLYILAVVYRGNSSALVKQVGESAGFVKWAFALAILAWFANSKTFGPVARPLLGMALVGLALNTYPKMEAEFSAFWATLK